LFVGIASAVELPAVGLGDQSLLRPEEVDRGAAVIRGGEGVVDERYWQLRAV
jgi:hypothetical protein